MRTVVVLDIDTTLANTDTRALCLLANCVQCGSVMRTLASHGRRNDYVCDACGCCEGRISQECWDNFLDPAMLLKDPVDPDAVRAIAAMRKHGMEMHVITGRGEHLRAVTEQWLSENISWKPNGASKLIMRPASFSNVSASDYKDWAFQKLRDMIQGQNASYFFFEDDEYVFRVYEKYGVVVRCPEGWRHFAPRAKYSKEPLWSR